MILLGRFFSQKLLKTDHRISDNKNEPEGFRSKIFKMKGFQSKELETKGIHSDRFLKLKEFRRIS